MFQSVFKIFKKKDSVSNSINESVVLTSHRRSAVQSLIQATRADGQAGLFHVEVLSKLLRSSIRVWFQNRLVRVFGRYSGKQPIDIEYNIDAPQAGHWSLRGGRNPDGACGLNNCLYNVVGAQAGEDASQLRRKTAKKIHRDLEVIAKRYIGQGDLAMLGGARYEGTSSRDAQRVLDASQNGRSYPDGRSGHPRGHASYPGGGRAEDSIESYSESRWRSGFMSREDQDEVCHYTLTTSYSKDLMEKLNSGSQKADSHIGRHLLDADSLPQAAIWDQGRMTSQPQDFQKVVLVGKHFIGEQNNVFADIFILTFYPVI